MIAGSVLIVLVVAAAPIGCDDRRPVVAPDPTTQESPRPKPDSASTEPSFEEKLAALSPYAPQTTRPVATTTFVDEFATTRPLPPDPLATPEGAINQFLAAARDGDARALRAVCLDDPYDPALQPFTDKLQAQTRAGVISLVEQRADGNVGVAIMCITGKRTGQRTYFALAMVNRFDQWRVQLGEVNPRRFSPEERAKLASLAKWTSNRIKELPTQSPDHATRGVAGAAATTRPSAR
jgi:hypothetical protein